ncbi:MAG: hypothetical protein WCJ56_04685 [bacterium]
MLIKSIEELENIKKHCKHMTTRRSLISATAAAVPIPLLDIGTDFSILMEMIPAINRKFGLTTEQIEELDTETKRVLFVTIKDLGAKLAGRVLTKELIIEILKKVGIRISVKTTAKYIPLVGAGVAAIVSYGAMKWIGNHHIEDCYQVVKRVLVEHKSRM